MAYQPTAAERAAFVALQGRMVELLMRYDVPRFSATFGEQIAEPSVELARGRDLAVVFYLRDELFERILPDIKRRLSFVAPRELVSEDLPPRGRIDWARTFAAGLRERPGEPPLRVVTRERRREFATAENLLTVATILEYRALVQQLLDNEYASGARTALRHPLNELRDACERELVFPQFVGLVAEAERLIADEWALAEIAATVAAALVPGRNSAYDDLLTWREQLRRLQLLERTSAQQPEPMLGSDPARDNALYQLWLFYEWVELLTQRDALAAFDPRRELVLRFRWGAGDDQRHYVLRYDLGVAGAPAIWQHAPGVRPDFYIAHAEPIRVGTGTTIWREPGFVLDAKYYREHDDRAHLPGEPRKRMLADLQLLGEQHGALLFAFHGANVEDDTVILAPYPDRAQRVAPDVTIRNLRVPPHPPEGVQNILAQVLDQIHAQLHARRVPQCAGVYLDTLSRADLALVDRTGRDFDASDDLLVCPKRHIGAWRVDFVSRQRHCLTDPALCHIIGQPGAQPPVRPVRSPEELLRELDRLFQRGAGTIPDDAQIARIAAEVERTTRQFAEFAGAYRRIDVYHNRVRDLGLGNAWSMLSEHEQESLALAIFLVEQLDSVGARDYSAPGIHISSVVETALRQRIFACPGLVGSASQPRNHTIGKLGYVLREDEDGNGTRIRAYAATRWNPYPDPDDPGHRIEFDNLVKRAVTRIGQLRNTAAHTEPLRRGEFEELLRIVLQRSAIGMGALRALLLGWQEPTLP